MTENGAAFHDKLIGGAVDDTERIEYFRLYLLAILRELKKKALILQVIWPGRCLIILNGPKGLMPGLA
ncbi:family 1 glycosylhydrolase [Pedobacter sp. NJ-S-72]